MNSDSIRPGDKSDESSEIEEASVTGSEEELELEEDADPIVDGPTTEAERVGKVVKLLPVHAAPNTGKNPLVVKRGRGRPRKVERMPTTSDLEYHGIIAEERGLHIDSDPVVKAAVANSDTADTLHLVKIEIAKEAASIHFQRLENEKFGKDTAQTSSRRIEALTKIAGIELEIKKLGANMIDLKSEKMQRVFRYFVERVRQVLTETLDEEEVDLVFNRLSTALEGWEDQCAELVTSKGE